MEIIDAVTTDTWIADPAVTGRTDPDRALLLLSERLMVLIGHGGKRLIARLVDSLGSADLVETSVQVVNAEEALSPGTPNVVAVELLDSDDGATRWVMIGLSSTDRLDAALRIFSRALET